MKQPILYGLVDKLYHGTVDHGPRFFQERPEATAAVLGGIGSYVVLTGVQAISRYIVDPLLPGFHDNILPRLEELCMIGITIGPALYAGIRPKDIHTIITEHPVYTSGMAGVWIGSMAAAAYDFCMRM